MKAEIRKMPWLYCEKLAEKSKIKLNKEESRHLRALRAKQGDKLVLFNGKGRLAVCELSGKEQAQVCKLIIEPKPKKTVCVATAVPKGERADLMMQKLAELGTGTIIPLKTRYSTVEPRAKKQERWQRILTEACKQAKRPHIPELRNLSSIKEALSAGFDTKILLKHSGKPIKQVNLPGSIIGLIGPEAGFTYEEEQLIKKSGATEASIGQYVLRIETAAIAFAAITGALS